MSEAAKAAEGVDEWSSYAATTGFKKLAAQPSGIWLTPEKYSIRTVHETVSRFVHSAARLKRVPIFVVYGIPNRDCGSESGGGLSRHDYPRWIANIASAVTNSQAVVILEPDSLALTVTCDNEAERLSEIRSGIEAFAKTQAILYIDGGHSKWLEPEKISNLLNQAGVQRVQGFFTNVANYNTTSREQRFAEQVSALTGGAHYVIDTSRNGGGSNGVWCNPEGRKLGKTTLVNTNGGAEDARLWIKPPGESDGYCNGGPVAGAWWGSRAEQLILDSNW
jgi:endoglucanase